MTISFDQIVSSIRGAIEPLPHVHAMMLGGSAAFGRLDEFSDIDAMLVVDSEQVEDTFSTIEGALSELSSIKRKCIVQEPAWHGHSQRFYDLEDASEFHQVDLFIMHRGKEPFFNEIEHHGHPVVIFDKSNVVNPVHMDIDELIAKLETRWPLVKQRLEMFGYMVRKELNRNHPLAALHFYQGMVLNPLVELLRILHSPFRHDWGIRYAHTDLPNDVYRKLIDLYYVNDVSELARKNEEAMNWFNKLAENLDINSVVLESQKHILD